MASAFDPYVGGGEDLHLSGPGTDASYDLHHYSHDEEHKDLDIDDDVVEGAEEKGSGIYGGGGGGVSLAEGGSRGFDDLDLGSGAPPPYRSPFDDDEEEEKEAGGYGDGGNISPSLSDPFRQPHFGSRNHTDFSDVDSNGKGFSSSHGEAFAHTGSEADGSFSSPFAYPFPSSSPSPVNGSGSVLPPPEEMEPEEGFILREWRRKNAIHLEQKAAKEREKLSQIIDAADAFKDEFYEKRRMNYEANKNNNRDKEKVFLENLTNFHATADKHYWKAIAELVPHELPSVESKVRGNKDKKKPSVVINHGPKPGKATDLTRMRQVLVKLKHNPPPHMKPPPPPAPPTDATATTAPSTTAPPPTVEGSDAKPTLVAAA